MSRKTFEILDVLLWANYNLQQSHHSPQFKEGVSALIEHILHSTNNYAGYSLPLIDVQNPQNRTPNQDATKVYSLRPHLQVDRDRKVFSEEELVMGIDAYKFQGYRLQSKIGRTNR